MSHPTLDHDVADAKYGPQGHQRYARKAGNTLDGLFAAVEQSSTALQSRGVAGPPIEIYARIMDAITQARTSAEQAEALFALHIIRQTALKEDPALSGTQEGGYLDPDEDR